MCKEPRLDAKTSPPRVGLKFAVHVALADRRARPAVWLAAAITALASQPGNAFEFELSRLEPGQGGDGSAGFVLAGIYSNSFTGDSVSAVGDVNGDGIDDFMIGAIFARDEAGQSYVVFGRDTAQSGTFPATFELSSLLAANGGDGSAGFVLNGADIREWSGYSVSEAGDVNADGIDDLLIGAAGDGSDDNGAGQAYVVFGRDAGQGGGFAPEVELASLLPANGGDGTAGFVLAGIVSNSRTGASVSAVGDVNGDGIDDLMIGASLADFAGQAYVVFGRSGRFPPVFPLAKLLPGAGGDGSKGFVLNGIDDDDTAGVSVSGAGDLNGDGIDDLIIGAQGADPGGRRGAGECYVVFGRDTAQAGKFPAEFELSSLLSANGGDGSAGFVLYGIDADDRTGRPVSAAGDINADGADDVVIGAWFASPSGQYRTGESYVVFGRNTVAYPAEFELSSLLAANGGDGSAGFVLYGIDAFDYFGNSVSAARDVSGDGIDDLIVGAVHADPDGRDNAGETYVIFGRENDFPPELRMASLVEGDIGLALNGIDSKDYAGTAVDSAGDVNGDGADDLIIGASGPYGGPGEVYVVFGPVFAPSDDLDGDGVSNSADNCSTTSNPDQRDTDGDEIGNVCDADLSNDCMVNFTDLGALKVRFFSDDPDADFNGDGVVNFVDLAAMKSAFFQPPGPSGLPNVCEDVLRKGDSAGSPGA